MSLVLQFVASSLPMGASFLGTERGPSTRHSIAAEYCGRNIDGETYAASAFSYDTGKYYYVDVEFSGEEVTIFFSNGGFINVTLDDEEIDDPTSIEAFDYSKGVYWELEVEGLECGDSSS